MANEEIAHGTGRVVAWLARAVESFLGESEMSLAQYRLLALLEERPEVASALADRLAVTRPSITTVVDGLVARGLVERGQDAGDRRRVTHALTDEGRRLLHEADDRIEGGLREVLGQLDPAGARDIAAGFQSLGDKLNERLTAWQQQEQDEQAAAAR